MSARSAEARAGRAAAVAVLAVLAVGCRRGDPKPLPPPGAPPGKLSEGEQMALAAAPPAVKLALEARRKAKSEKWRNERPMMLRVHPRAVVPEPVTPDGELEPASCAELCFADVAKCWAVEAHAPSYTPKRRRPAIDCTDGKSVSLTEDELGSLRSRASDGLKLDDEVCRERCKSEGCFLAGLPPDEVFPVQGEERLVLCAATKIVAEDAPP